MRTAGAGVENAYGLEKARAGVTTDHSLNVIFKLLTVCHSINELASLPASETFLFTHYGGK